MPTGIVRRPPKTRRTSSGVADVARSQSRCGWPSRASRIAPPTHHASKRLGFEALRDVENGRRRVKASHRGTAREATERWRIARPVSAVKVAALQLAAANPVDIFLRRMSPSSGRRICANWISSWPRRKPPNRSSASVRSLPRVRVRPVAAGAGAIGPSGAAHQSSPAAHAVLAAEPDLAVEHVALSARSGCSDFVGVCTFTRRPKRTSTNSSGIAAGAPSRKAGLDCFGFPDQTARRRRVRLALLRALGAGLGARLELNPLGFFGGRGSDWRRLIRALR